MWHFFAWPHNTRVSTLQWSLQISCQFDYDTEADAGLGDNFQPSVKASCVGGTMTVRVDTKKPFEGIVHGPNRLLEKHLLSKMYSTVLWKTLVNYSPKYFYSYLILFNLEPYLNWGAHFFKDGSTQASFSFILSLCTGNLSSHQDSNSDRQSRRGEPWPPDKTHGSTEKLTLHLAFRWSRDLTVDGV